MFDGTRFRGDTSYLRDGIVIIVGQNVSPILQELLDEELGTEPTTIRGLTNHLPMALVAKERLGAVPDELSTVGRS